MVSEPRITQMKTTDYTDKRNKGQNTIEYFIIMTIILAAILSSRIIERVRGGFEGYFNSAAERIK